MDDPGGLQFLGLTWPSTTYLVGSLAFGLIGFLGYQHGTKLALPRLKWIGIALMLYPYAVADTRLMYACGAILCGLLYLYRKPRQGI